MNHLRHKTIENTVCKFRRLGIKYRPKRGTRWKNEEWMIYSMICVLFTEEYSRKKRRLLLYVGKKEGVQRYPSLKVLNGKRN